MKYLSLFSGIEAASAAWGPLGWEPLAFSEIDPFPSAVLAHHYPGVPNLGDVTRFHEWPDLEPDIIVGGSPCQAFSIAGLRKGLDDPRGNLTLTYLAVVDRYRPQWVVWENVPGVLSHDGGRTFGTFLGALAKLGYGWAYRVMDAQYVRVQSHPRAVPQRRRRVFVVGCAGDGRRAAQVLFEPESLRGNPPPRREAGKDAPAFTPAGVGACGAGNSRTGARHLIAAIQERAVCENAAAGPDGVGVRTDGAAYTMEARTVPQAVVFGTEGVAPTIPSRRSAGGGLGTDFDCDGGLVAFGGNNTQGPIDVATARNASTTASGRMDFESETFLVAHSLKAEGFDASEDGTGRGVPLVADTLTCNGAKAGNNAGMVNPVINSLGVHRLTPTECEALQGFPRGYTDIIYRGKRAMDGPRYKSLGNSMATNVMSWIGQRIKIASATSPLRRRGFVPPSENR